MAKACEFPAAEMREIVIGLAAVLPEGAKTVAEEMKAVGLDHPVIPVLRELLGKRAVAIGKLFERDEGARRAAPRSLVQALLNKREAAVLKLFEEG